MKHAAHKKVLPACGGACPVEIVPPRAIGGGSQKGVLYMLLQVEVGKTDCFNACKRSPSVRVLRADGEPTALAGMGMQETKKFCFSMVRPFEPSIIIVVAVGSHRQADALHLNGVARPPLECHTGFTI